MERLDAKKSPAIRWRTLMVNVSRMRVKHILPMLKKNKKGIKINGKLNAEEGH